MTNQTLLFSATMRNIVILVVLIGIGLVDECLGACDSKTCIGGTCNVTTKSCNQGCGWGKCDLTCTSSVRNCIQDCKWKDCKAISNPFSTGNSTHIFGRLTVFIHNSQTMYPSKVKITQHSLHTRSFKGKKNCLQRSSQLFKKKSIS